MGSWGVGMQANDTALDAVCDYKDHRTADGRPIRRLPPLGVLLRRAALDDERHGDGLATLGLADWLLDQGHDLRPYLDLLSPAVACELAPAQLDCWADPAERYEALRRFWRRACGLAVDPAELERDNEGLLVKMARALDGPFGTAAAT